MPIIIPHSEVQQNTDAWHQLRLGIPTSSQFSRILKKNGERSKSWHGYLDELAVEIISGQKNTFESWEMRLGHEQEPEARWLYSQMNEVNVELVGFIFKDESKKFGASTDGLVGKDGIFECKGGKGVTHISRLRDHKKNPDLFVNEHFHQLQGELYVCEREWCDLFGFFPGMVPLEVRVYRNEGWISKLESALKDFIDELDDLVSRIKAK